MNIKKQINKLKDWGSKENRISYATGYVIDEHCDSRYHFQPKVHYIDIKSKMFGAYYIITIYCERPGLLIGKAGCIQIYFRKNIKKF